MSVQQYFEPYLCNYQYHQFETAVAIHADCFEWMGQIPKASIHAIVTDPPYGVKEYDFDQIEKRQNGNGGVWRIPPSFDGHLRSPLPRFTALTSKERERLQRFFYEWGMLALRVLRPGGHVIIASNAFLSQLVFSALVEAGLEFRGQFIRLVRTLRGGDRPKNAETAYPDVCSLPRGCYEPWGIFRQPFACTVEECLQTYQTGGLRRLPDGKPLFDVLPSEKTPRTETKIAHHPTVKPQSLMRQLVYASLPLGQGIILDPFMGSGSTLAAACTMGLSAIGIERYFDYFSRSKDTIPALAQLPIQLEHWDFTSSIVASKPAQLSMLFQDG